MRLMLNCMCCLADAHAVEVIARIESCILSFLEEIYVHGETPDIAVAVSLIHSSPLKDACECEIWILCIHQRSEMCSTVVLTKLDVISRAQWHHTQAEIGFAA